MTKLVFAPGCFDNFDGTQEELDALVAEIKKMAEDGTLAENSKPLSPDEENALLFMLAKKAARQ